MYPSATLDEALCHWASREPSIKALLLFGSRSREASDKVWAADAHSDWDFMAVTSRPSLFATSEWASSLGLEVQAYVFRETRMGGVPRVTALLNGQDVDLILHPLSVMRMGRLLMALGRHRKPGAFQRRVCDLAEVIRPGYRFLKGGEQWGPFYRQVTEAPPRRLSDADACTLATGFILDAKWVQRKIQRGELIAAQRTLHLQLAEVNLQLAHELRLRHGGRSFPEGRRLEQITPEAEVDAFRLKTEPTPASLSAALHKASNTLQDLMARLVPAWQWPLPLQPVRNTEALWSWAPRDT